MKVQSSTLVTRCQLVTAVLPHWVSLHWSDCRRPQPPEPVYSCTVVASGGHNRDNTHTTIIIKYTCHHWCGSSSLKKVKYLLLTTFKCKMTGIGIKEAWTPSMICCAKVKFILQSKTLPLLQIFGIGSGQIMQYKIIAANLAMHQLYSVCTIPSVYTSLISSSLHFTFISWMSYSVPGKRMNAEFVKFTNSILNFLKTAGSIDWRREKRYC